MSTQRDNLLSVLSRLGISCVMSGEREIAISCPQCSPYHRKHKQTLYLNASTGSYKCFRCVEKLASIGGDGEKRAASLARLLAVFGLQASIEDVVGGSEVSSLRDLRRRLMGMDVEPPVKDEVVLPTGFRKDWAATLVGRTTLRYMRKNRRLTDEIIDRSEVGYVKEGCLVFPITINGVIKSWQTRQVLFNIEPKYVICPGTKAHSLLYNYDNLNGSKVTLVEGIFDSLSVPQSVALLGKVISSDQIALLARKN
ncbi:hypothetical protein LCGC14_2472400, partial [marine sediment metagenome]